MSLHDILCWVDPVATGIVFSVLLCALLLLRLISILSLIAYTGLLSLAAAFSFRIFCLVTELIFFWKGDLTHCSCFRVYLENPIVFPTEKIHGQVDIAVDCLQKWLNEAKHLFLIENIFDSLKLAVLLWALTYVGTWLSMYTLALLGLLYAFTVPLLLHKHGATIDKYYSLACNKMRDLIVLIDSKAPFLRLRQLLVKEEAEKKKE
ncbi:Reticulon 4 [Trichuris trichiura]|uniref:Reticulon-like protein n=1 Tax=Trichuris trichiura TaxID=36087 RepID=A0A077Z2C5_TRITR|nr:Reticulon 4 [Trichuris trichiura]